MTEQVYSISQISEYIRIKMDADTLLSSVAVSGEISNYKLYPSGHHYFTLKDEGGALKCVMFRSNATRLRFRPENGMKVIATGKITVYPRDGVYQLYCTGLTVAGAGDLHAAFEQLKKKLSALGLFDPAHKKPLPAYPATIGLITSSAGAAVHDMLRILRKRYPLVTVKLIPVRVQGAEAPDEIASAIAYTNAHSLADLLIVGRGGGSIEDLWAFNDEKVAYAIFRSKIPIISAVGHEPDITIADYVADVRAATPSNGAELAVPDQDSIRQLLDSQLSTMTASVQQQLQNARRQLKMFSSCAALQSQDGYIRQKRKTLALLDSQLISAHSRVIHRCKQHFLAQTAKLDAMSPLKVLTRGYSITQDNQGNMVRSVKQVSEGSKIQIRLGDGSLEAQVRSIHYEK